MPERPFKIRLCLLDPENAGKRLRVEGALFVIGRHDDCDLQLQSSLLSRRHCEIIIDNATRSVSIRDLGSRNGTFVNDQKLDANMPVSLFHNDVLRVGKLSFRLSIKDSVTDEPHRNPLSVAKDPLASLLSELDEMAHDTSLVPNVKARGLLAIPRQEPRPVPQEFPTVVEGLGESTVDPNMETQPIIDTVAGETVSGSTESTGNTVTDADERNRTVNVKKEPMKLPEHLRRRAVDSQEAATEALKRLFSGGS